MTINTIKKRCGTEVPYESNKILDAVDAARAVTNEFSNYSLKEILNDVEAIISKSSVNKPRILDVETIQDFVEEALIQRGFVRTAKAYILYRDRHSRLRDLSSSFHSQYILEYIKKNDWKVEENSNMGYSLQGLNNYISSEVSRKYWLNQVYSSDIKEACTKGSFHIHDLGSISAYCVGWDLPELLLKGFKGVSGKVEAKPPKHFRTALGQVVNFFYTLQGEAAGAQAFSNFDTLLAPYIRYDKLSYALVKQAMQEFLFNMNIPTRVGFQTPYTNLTFDLKVPSCYKDTPVIIGGELQKEKYAEFQMEMDMLNRAFLEVMREGDAKGRVFTFPIPTYNITKDFDWDNPISDLLCDVTARYGLPYFANFIGSDMKEEDVRSMCCRLRLDLTQLTRKGGGYFGSNPLTGSIGVVTINMPILGHTSKDSQEFFIRLGEVMSLAKDSLETKRTLIENFTEEDLYPYCKFYLSSLKERTGSYWKNHFSTIGILGMNEACLNFLGQDIGSEEGKKFSLEVLGYMRRKLLEFQKETGNLYNLEATPAESTSYRLALIDKQAHPSIICANEEDYKKGSDPFYTNSTQLPVDFTDDVFEALDLQDKLQCEYTGGTVLHFFLKEKIKESTSVKTLVKTICTRYKLPYFTLTPTFSICPQHGYLNGEVKECPQCKAVCEVYSRSVGYLRPVSQWNKGKRQEFKVRKTMKEPSLALDGAVRVILKDSSKIK